MNRQTYFLAALLFTAALLSSAVHAEAFLDVEGGVAFTGYNDVKIPSSSGTKFSLKDDIVSDPAPALRLRGGYTFFDRHTVLVLIAPLTVRGSATLDKDITYQGVTFAKGTKAESVYRFDSYRATYRYSFVKNDTLQLAAGLTGKIRDADIAIMSDDAYAHRSNLGAVPLINFMTQWKFNPLFSVLLDADALVTPFGRAEDVLLALQYHPSDKVAVRAGYRVLDGGSDGGGNVYTFALFNYATAGITVSF